MKLDVAFDLDFSLCCGQVFRWQKIEGWWYGVVGEHVVKVRQIGTDLEIKNVSENFARHYFGLDDDLEEISRSIDKDNYIKDALQRFRGLRIIRQVPWECLISFICATYKSIAAIELMLKKISIKYGERIVNGGKDFYAFPTVERLTLASEKGLRECGLGYRAKYVQATAKKIYAEKIDLQNLKSMPYFEARKILLDLQGVGLKVADCVLLFSLEKMEAFPLDVWVKRAILNHYSDKLLPEMVRKMRSQHSVTKGEYDKIGAFARNYFGHYAGYAQEYLYHHERTQR